VTEIQQSGSEERVTNTGRHGQTMGWALEKQKNRECAMGINNVRVGTNSDKKKIKESKW